MKTTEIQFALDNLMSVATVGNDMALKSMLYAIQGAYAMGAEDILCYHISEFLRSTLMPLAQQGIHNKPVSQN